MSKLVVQGALLRCTMGAAPASFALASSHRVDGVALASANVNDNVPNANIPPFGLCQSTANPQVQAATAAAQGVLTPQPCVPVVEGPWTPGSETVTVGDLAALDDSCTCTCQWGGTISVTAAGQEDVELG